MPGIQARVITQNFLSVFRNPHNYLPCDLLVYFKQGHAFKDEIDNSIIPPAASSSSEVIPYNVMRRANSPGSFSRIGIYKLHML